MGALKINRFLLLAIITIVTLNRCGDLSKQDRYEVTYNGNGNTSGTVPIDNNTYLPGENVIVLKNEDSFARTGFSFIGWNTKSDGSGITYIYGDSFKMESSDVILYAKWQPISGSILYSDNFESNTLGKNWSTDSYGEYNITNGQFIISGISDTYVACSSFLNYINQTSFQVAVDTEWKAGITNNSYGILFYNTGGNSQYRFVICANGYYCFLVGINALVDWTYSSLINVQGWNRLTVQCNLAQYNLIINGTIVKSITDNSFQSCFISLAVSNAQTVGFDNFVISVYP